MYICRILIIVIQFENYSLLFLFALLAIFVSFFFLKKQELSVPWIRYTIGILRFLSLFTLLVLLLSPILKCKKTNTIKPKIVVLCDNSRSLKRSNIADYKSELNRILENIDYANYEIEVRTFDKKLEPLDSLNQMGGRTNIYSALTEVMNSNSDANLNRILLITDGNYNEGNNPAFLNNRDMIPIDVLLVGDTLKVSDYKIENIEYNNLMLHDEVNPLNIIISAYAMTNSEARVSLEELTNGGTKLISQTKVTSTKNNFSQTIQFKLSGISKGKHKYRVSVSSNIKEKNLRNNSREFTIDVIDGTKQIEILSSFPHPDLTALKSWLGSNKSFNVILNVSESNLSFSEKADVVIFYQVPNQFNNGKSLFEKAKANGKSVLFVLGTKSDYNAFNQLQQSYKVNVMGGILQDYGNKLNPNFLNFYLNENLRGEFQAYPPLSNYLITIESKANASHLLLSRLGRIESDQPLVSFSYHDNIQIGLIAAENIWKWRVNNYQIRKNFEETQDLLDKIINYLAIMKSKKQLVVNLSNDNIVEGDHFTITANTYNEMYQPKRAEKISCFISGSDFKKRSYDMLPIDNSFSLSPKDLKAGLYHYEITAAMGGKLMKEMGSFSIVNDDLEDVYIASNYEDMYALAKKSGGDFFMWQNRENFIKKRNTGHNAKEKLVEETIRLKANDILYLLLFILLLLSSEWLIRKYFGLN